jgi:hypothetical protein
MSRLAVLVSILIALLAVPAPTIDAASQATPVAASLATQDNGEMLDLPALAPQPADFVAVGRGEGFGIHGGGLFTLEEHAELAARNRGDSSASRVAEITARMEDAGFRQGYFLFVSEPADDGTSYGMGVAAEISEYADEAGAAAGFAYATDTAERVDIEVEEIAGSRRFGDESLTWRGSYLDPETGTPSSQALGIDARVGRLTVSIANYEEPDQALVEALMERLLDRVAREARPARGELAYLVPRLSGEGVEMDYDYYGRLHGVSLPSFGETAETRANREARISATRDIYHLGQLVSAGGDGSQDDIWYNIDLYRFGAAEDAAAWLDGILLAIPARPVVADMPPLGDQATTFLDEKDRGEGVVATGLVTFLRTGTDVLILAVSAVPGVERAGYEELLARNVECLDSGLCLDPVPAPQDLITREGFATPEAGSSTTQATPAI